MIRIKLLDPGHIYLMSFLKLLTTVRYVRIVTGNLAYSSANSSDGGISKIKLGLVNFQ
jgi:hypothetical protein